MAVGNHKDGEGHGKDKSADNRDRGAENRIKGLSDRKAHLQIDQFAGRLNGNEYYVRDKANQESNDDLKDESGKKGGHVCWKFFDLQRNDKPEHRTQPDRKTYLCERRGCARGKKWCRNEDAENSGENKGENFKLEI